MAGAKRRSFETGHRPKFLVVVDESPECDRAVRFAARRSARTGASLLLLAIVDPPDTFEWLGVADALRAEAEEEAGKLIAASVSQARHAAGLEPEHAVRIGDKADAVLAQIDEDEDISFLVLAAASGTDGPGPLVTTMMGLAAGAVPVPIVIVPGHLADAEIDALAG